MTDHKLYRHRFPLSIIQHALWLDHRFPLKVISPRTSSRAGNHGLRRPLDKMGQDFMLCVPAQTVLALRPRVRQSGWLA